MMVRPIHFVYPPHYALPNCLEKYRVLHRDENWSIANLQLFNQTMLNGINVTIFDTTPSFTFIFQLHSLNLTDFLSYYKVRFNYY